MRAVVEREADARGEDPVEKRLDLGCANYYSRHQYIIGVSRGCLDTVRPKPFRHRGRVRRRANYTVPLGRA
jgi:hypothetical protein